MENGPKDRFKVFGMLRPKAKRINEALLARDGAAR
jgi:hypothetical protein